MLKCSLKPIDAADYARTLSAEQLRRLGSVFSTHPAARAAVLRAAELRREARLAIPL